VITRYNVCEVACSAYTAALTPGNIQGAFRRAGIHPFNPQAIPHEKLLPAEVFRPLAESDTETVDSQATVEGGIAEGIDKTMDMFSEKERTLRKAKSEHKVKPRNAMSKIVAGKEIDERVLEKMNDHVRKQGMKSTNTEKKGKRVKGAQQKKRVAQSPQPGPSRIITSDTDSDSEVGDTELCCQCKRYTPAEMSRCFIFAL